MVGTLIDCRRALLQPFANHVFVVPKRRQVSTVPFFQNSIPLTSDETTSALLSHVSTRTFHYLLAVAAFILNTWHRSTV